MERSTIFNGKIHYKWPFSIAMLVHQRVKRTGFPQFIWHHGYSMLFMDYDTHDTLQFIGKYNPQTNRQHTLALHSDSMIPL